MKYRLKVLSLYELGQRKNQEDYIYPPLGKVKDDERLFIVCDGMGGHEKGEVASKTVCEKISEYLAENYVGEEAFTEDIFKAALSYAYDALDALDDGAEKKMGTTLTFLMFHDEGCLAAHIGDSRIYHIRPSEPEESRIRFVTRDHSLVNDLVAVGEMTPEEAKTSRQKNIITRAMQPNQERRSRADICNIQDVRPGDYFYMCSDGMLEQAEDVEIANVISMKNKTDEEKIEMFRVLTKDNKDNHSAHLIKVLSVNPEETVEDDEIETVTEEIKKDHDKVRQYAIPVIVLIGCFCLFHFCADDVKALINRKPEKVTVDPQPVRQYPQPHSRPKPKPEVPTDKPHDVQPVVADSSDSAAVGTEQRQPADTHVENGPDTVVYGNPDSSSTIIFNDALSAQETNTMMESFTREANAQQE